MNKAFSARAFASILAIFAWAISACWAQDEIVTVKLKDAPISEVLKSI